MKADACCLSRSEASRTQRERDIRDFTRHKIMPVLCVFLLDSRKIWE